MLHRMAAQKAMAPSDHHVHMLKWTLTMQILIKGNGNYNELQATTTAIMNSINTKP